MSDTHVMSLVLSELQVRWGDGIRGLRQQRDLSLAKLARLADIDQGHLSRIENGASGVGDEARFRLAAALGVRVEEIFCYPDTAKDQATS
jgi:transcriptional regulator with XRE-family HTH domain